MISATRSRAGSWTLVGPVDMSFMKQAKLHIEEIVQELELKMKARLQYRQSRLPHGRMLR